MLQQITLFFLGIWKQFCRRGAVQQLEEGMGRLASVSAEVEASLAEVQAALKEERTRQQQFQVMVLPVVRSVFSPRPSIRIRI